MWFLTWKKKFPNFEWGAIIKILAKTIKNCKLKEQVQEILTIPFMWKRNFELLKCSEHQAISSRRFRITVLDPFYMLNLIYWDDVNQSQNGAWTWNCPWSVERYFWPQNFPFREWKLLIFCRVVIFSMHNLSVIIETCDFDLLERYFTFKF